jgi:hypothetical protein
MTEEMKDFKSIKNMEDLIEYLTRFSNDQIPIYKDICFNLAEAKGWDIKLLDEFFARVSNINKELEAQKEKEEVEDIKDKVKNSIEGATTKEDLRKILDGSAKETGTKIILKTIPKPYSWNNYIDDTRNYDPDKEFRPKLFNDGKEMNLSFPDGTMSVIGARTGIGKTTALINLALDAISDGGVFSNENLLEDRSRKCLFITREMSGRQLFNKLILSRAYSRALSQSTTQDLNKINSYSTLFKIINDPKDIDILPNIETNHENKKHIIIKEDIEFIQERVESGKIIMQEAFHMKLEEISTLISKQGKGTLVLIDYMQRLPDPSDKNYDGFMRVKRISDAIVKATIESEAVTICDAQFNRNVNLEKEFTDASFRESGDIEQDAHNAIGIGLKEDKISRFFKVLKAREGNATGKIYNIEFEGAWAFMKIGDKFGNEEDIENHDTSNKRGKIAGSNPGKLIK